MIDRKYVIAVCSTVIMLVGMVPQSRGQGSLERRIDSLFVIASSGEVKYRDMVEPAIDSIAALGAPAVPHLIDKFTTKSARERLTIIAILKEIGSPAVPDLVAALKRSDGLVVQRVCWALGDIKDSTAVPGLIGVVRHPRWQVRDQAVGALGKIGDGRANKAVVTALTDPVDQVRKAATVAVGRLGINEAAPELVSMLGDPFYGARLTALESLLRLDTNTVYEILTDSVHSTDTLVGDLSCAAFGQIGSDFAIEQLRWQSKSQRPARRARAAVALIDADPLNRCGYHNELVSNEQDPTVLLQILSAIHDAQQRQAVEAQ